MSSNKPRTSEKKVEVHNYPTFKKFLEMAFPKHKLECWYGSSDYPVAVKDHLKESSKKGGAGGGVPDAIFYLTSKLTKYLFVFEAKGKGIEQASKEAEHYCKALESMTFNIFRCSLDNEHFRIVHHLSGTDIGITSMLEFDIGGHHYKNPAGFVYLVAQMKDFRVKDIPQARSNLTHLIRSMNSSLRKVGLSGQDRIDFASSLFLMKEIYDAGDEDFRQKQFSRIQVSKDILETLTTLNDIATHENVGELFPDFSHLIAKDHLINMEKFNRIIPKDDGENTIKASGDDLNNQVMKLFKNDVINLSRTDFDFRGAIVEEFTHGNKGGGVSKEYGEFFTPRHIIKFAVDLAGLKPGDKVFDPAFGTGGFLIEAFKKLVEMNNGEISDQIKRHSIYGNELHDWNVKAAKASLIALGDGHSNLQNTDFIKGFNKWNLEEDGKDFRPDVVLMNPPYSLGGESSEWHFVQKCFDKLLNSSGADGKERVLVAVLPYEDVSPKSIMSKYADYIDAYISLPYGVFLKYTSVRTHIVVLSTTKKYRNISRKISEPIFVAKAEQDGFTLDNYRRAHESNDLPLIFEAYRGFKKVQEEARKSARSIRELQEKLRSGEIDEQNYSDQSLALEKALVMAYSSNFRNTDKCSLLDYHADVLPSGHFDKALWFKTNDFPTLGKSSPSNKKISDYFSVVSQTASFSDPGREELPYIEISGIELLSGFYKESLKPKAVNRDEHGKVKAEEGEIKGGYLGMKGDVLISMVRTYRGAFTVLREEAIVSKSAFLVLRPKSTPSKPAISSDELLSLLKVNLSDIVRYINYVGAGKTYPKIEQSDFLGIYLDAKSATAAKTKYIESIIRQVFEIYEINKSQSDEVLKKIQG